MNRGAGRRVVFRSDDERRLMLSLVAELDHGFGVEVHAYCLMGNHFHLLMQSRQGRLSEAMAWLGSRFTRLVNIQRGVDGAVFRGRFHSVAVAHPSHLDWLFRYVNANPLALGWERPLADYRWSGLAASLGRRASEAWVATDYVRSRFGNDPSGLEAFVEAARSVSPPLACRSARPLAGGVATDREIAGAVQIARAPGPDVNTDAECRAVHTVIAASVGLPAADTSSVGHLDRAARLRYTALADRRCASPGRASDLLGRAVSVMRIGHRVSDTE